MFGKFLKPINLSRYSQHQKQLIYSEKISFITILKVNNFKF